MRIEQIADRLPSITVTALEETRGKWTGRCHVDAYKQHDWFHLEVWIRDDVFVWLRVDDRDPRTGEACFVVMDDSPGPLQVGSNYRWLDGYWGERARLVLERWHEWRRVRFALYNHLVPLPDDSTITNDWIHEHCAVCWEKIAEYAAPYGYVDQDESWLCQECHDAYAVPRSIAFIPDHDLRTPSGSDERVE